MLSEQTYGQHTSIHDAATAQRLGIEGAAIEGPTHFSQYDPLLAALWGRRWFESGTLSAHFHNICVAGEQTRATVRLDGTGGHRAQLGTEKDDGTPVLTGTASLRPQSQPSAVRQRLAAIRPPTDDLIIYTGWQPGRRGSAPEHVTMGSDTHLGDLYPFTLRQKLAAITEPSTWYESKDNPWGRPIIPTEMISVLAMATFGRSGLVKAEPSVGLFLDLEISITAGPLFVDAPYVLEREVVGVSESRRTESVWILTTVTDDTTKSKVAQVLLHQGALKESYPGYPQNRIG
jgi:hypothetical protein